MLLRRELGWSISTFFFFFFFFFFFILSYENNNNTTTTNRAAKRHQLTTFFGGTCEQLNLSDPRAIQNAQHSVYGGADNVIQRRPSSSCSSRSIRSRTSSYAPEILESMDNRLAALERTLTEERTGRQHVQKQLDNLRALLENHFDGQAADTR